ncbi:hypothetical protein [Paenibacillus sp. yr247]|uniref:hypothetical protein n=1 Tax=Paenibacillus sp. yr247 TaxID=1761880 RepID=UPI0015879654|nr:hypothetical protein [Paenibacillus sp. yr247]
MGVTDSNIQVDHLNHFRADNREKNLRVCYKGEPHNMENTKIDFYFPDIVEITRNVDEICFTLKASNGIYTDVQFNYLRFEDVLKHRKFLYDKGLEIGLPSLIEIFKEEAYALMEMIPQESAEYKDCLELLDYFKIKYEEARENVNWDVHKFLEENDIDISKVQINCPFFLKDGTLVILQSVGMTSKIKKGNPDISKLIVHGKWQDE